MYKNMNTELYIYTCTYTHLHEGDMKRYSSWLAYGWIKTWLAYTFFNTTLFSGMILNGEISVLDSIGSPMFQKARLRIWFCLIQHLHMYLKWVSWCLCVCMNTHEGDKRNKLQCKTGYKHQESKLSPVPICAYGTVNGQTELASMSL